MFEEIENKDKKHGIAFTILGVFVLFAMLAGVAVAAYTWSFTSEKANTIGTGTISMSFLESTSSINITNALPMGDTTGIEQGDNQLFDFAVTTKASGKPGNINYNISITKLAVDDGYTQLADNQVKIYLTTLGTNGKEVQVVKPTLVSAIITSGDTGTLTFDSDKTSYLTHIHTTENTSSTTKYRLRMWVDKNVDASSWTKDTKNQYKLKVNASGALTAA